MFLAPLRGVTIRCFRETFSREIVEAGFKEAVTPFISANAGVDPLKDRELRGGPLPFRVTPQFIGKDPQALKTCLERIKSAGCEYADLNAGCPFPMVRNKGRGSGLLKDSAKLAAMLEAGCETMGEGKFSVKTRLGVERTDELKMLMPLFNAFPLRFIVVHARTAKEMYSGKPHMEEFEEVKRLSRNRVIYNGDAPFPQKSDEVMIGRPFVRALGARVDSRELLSRYIAASVQELGGGPGAVGRIKELVAYWKDLPRWEKLWPVLKLARTVKELEAL